MNRNMKHSLINPHSLDLFHLILFLQIQNQFKLVYININILIIHNFVSIFIQFPHSMKSHKTLTVLITGASRGIGKDLARIMSKNLHQNSHLILTTRFSDEQNKKIEKQWSNQFKDKQFSIKNLEILSKQSIIKFTNEIKESKIKIDILVNNAGIGFVANETFDTQIASKTLSTNTLGPIQLTNLLLQSLSQNAKIFNVSSEFAALFYQSKQLQQQLTNPHLQQKQVISAIQEYISAKQNKNMGKWHWSSYCTSKMLLSAWSRFCLKDKLKQGQVSIAFSPGYCNTDMSGPQATYTSESGAQCLYDLVFRDNLNYETFYYRDIQTDYIKCGPTFVDFL